MQFNSVPVWTIQGRGNKPVFDSKNDTPGVGKYSTE